MLKPQHAAAGFLMLFLCGLALFPAHVNASPPSGPHAWTIEADPEALGWNAERLRDLTTRADEMGSAAVLIVTEGKIVFQYGDINRKFRAHSMRKSFLSALYGIYAEGGEIDLGATLQQLGVDDKTPLSAAEKQATLYDLLMARSGVYHPAASETAEAKKLRPERGSHDPGTFWYYNNWDHNTLGTVFNQRTGTDLFLAFKNRIADPVGMQDFTAADTRYQLEDVSNHPSYKFRMSTRDLARFGLLYLNRGNWYGQQIIPEDWVKKSTSPLTVTGRKGTKSGYGLMWWVGSHDRQNAGKKFEDGIFTASGARGHRLTILPKIHTVVVHRMNTERGSRARIGSSTYDRFLTAIMSARTESP